MLLCMAGRNLSNGPGQVQVMGYLGLQILLSNYGRALASD